MGRLSNWYRRLSPWRDSDTCMGLSLFTFAMTIIPYSLGDIHTANFLATSSILLMGTAIVSRIDEIYG